MISDEARLLIKTLPVIASIQEVANFFSVAYLTVYRLVRREKLEAYKDDANNWCIPRDCIEKFYSKNCNL